MTTTIKIDGEAVTPSATSPWLARLDLARGQVGTLTLQRWGKLPAVPDEPPPSPPAPDETLLGHQVQIEIDGSLVFTGDVVDEQAEWTSGGWVTTYQARCLRDRGDRVPLVDANTLTTTANYNRPASDLLYVPGRAGRTVGQAIADVLTTPANAEALHALGIGGYVESGGVWSLPAETVADLAALDRIPPQVLTIGGERILSAIAAALEANAVNHDMIVRPDGVLRFVDRRECVEQPLTVGDCAGRAQLRSVRRSAADCSSAVETWGQPKAEPKLVSLSNAGLVRAYAHSGLTNDQAEAAWTPEDFLRGNRSIGTCVVTDTLHVTINPDDNGQHWDANAFDQANWGGMVTLTVAVIAGVTSTVTRRVVANTALTAGGTCVLTLDEPLPATDYTRFELYGKNAGASLVYRRYRVNDPDIRAALARKFSAEAMWTWATGQAETTTLYPMAAVVWYESGATLPSEVTDDFTIDGDGYITFARPTYFAAGKKPDDVKALLAVNVGSLEARAPASGHEGTAHDLYGIERPLRKFVKNWTDPGNQAAQEAYARELLDAVKDVTVDVSVEIGKIWTPALDFANGLSVVAAGYATGLESANLPIRSVSVSWNHGSASDNTMSIQASNRRGSLQPEDLLPPERQRQGFTWGSADSVLSPRPTGGRP